MIRILILVVCCFFWACCRAAGKADRQGGERHGKADDL